MRYIYDHDTGEIKGLLPYNFSLTSSLPEVKTEDFKIINGELVEKPLISGLGGGLREGYFPSMGNVSEGTAEIGVQGGDHVSLLTSALDDDLYLETPAGISKLLLGENEHGWNTPLGDGIYYMYIHKSGHKSAKLKIIARTSFPYPI